MLRSYVVRITVWPPPPEWHRFIMVIQERWWMVQRTVMSGLAEYMNRTTSIHPSIQPTWTNNMFAYIIKTVIHLLQYIYFIARLTNMCVINCFFHLLIILKPVYVAHTHLSYLWHAKYIMRRLLPVFYVINIVCIQIYIYIVLFLSCILYRSKYTFLICRHWTCTYKLTSSGKFRETLDGRTSSD